MSTIAYLRFRLIALLSAILTLAAAPVDATLLLYYDFNDGAASATDKSGFGNSGTIIGASYSDPGTGYNNTPGRSMDFNGGTNIIQVDNGATAFDSVLTTGSISIAFWIFGDVLGDPRPGNPNTNFSAFDATTARQLMAHVPWQDGVVYFDAAGGFGAGVNRISKDATANQFEGIWNHWVFIKEGSGAAGISSIYINNTLFHSGPTSAAFGDFESFYVGGNGRSTTEGYHGLIDEFAVWDHALSPAERTQVFSGVIPEPASASLLGGACLFLLSRRRRR